MWHPTVCGRGHGVQTDAIALRCNWQWDRREYVVVVAAGMSFTVYLRVVVQTRPDQRSVHGGRACVAGYRGIVVPTKWRCIGSRWMRSCKVQVVAVSFAGILYWWMVVVVYYVGNKWNTSARCCHFTLRNVIHGGPDQRWCRSMPYHHSNALHSPHDDDDDDDVEDGAALNMDCWTSHHCCSGGS